MSTGWLINSLRTSCTHFTNCNVYSCVFTQTRDYAARKGTREKARKKKVKVIVEKVGFIPHNLRRKKGARDYKEPPMISINDSWKSTATDNVWITKYHKRPVYSFQEAIEFHRETHHPTMYNMPNAYVNALIELDMQKEKKTKFFDKFTRIVDAAHFFQQKNERTVLAFCKTIEAINSANEAGASFVGGIEMIKQIQAGEFPYKDYNYYVATADILPELLLIRGLLKKKFPNAKSGNLGHDVGQLVKKFMNGIEYTAVPNADFKEFGKINVTFGTLDMETKQLKQNFSNIINDLEAMKPKRDSPFILRVQISCSPSPETFKIDFEELVSSKIKQEVEEEEDDNTIAVIATN